EILSSVESVLDGADGIRPRALFAAREFPPKDVPSVERITGTGDAMDIASESEARQVARRIRALAAAGVPYKDVAVLARTMSALGPLQTAFDDAAVPFLVTGGRTFLEAREVRDAVLLLRVIENPLDEIALAGVLRSPLVGLDDETVLRILRLEQHAPEFEQRLAEARAAADSVSPDRLLTPFFDACDYEGRLGERQRANLEKFLSYLQRRHAASPESLWTLLQHLDALRDAQSEAEAPPSGEAGDMVRLMTVHTAKGLEFPVVFVVALGAQTSNRTSAILFSPSHGLGIQWRNSFDGKGYGDLVHRTIAKERSARDKEEENRLLYVAMTRAQDHLVLADAFNKRKAAWQGVVHKSLGLGVESQSDSAGPSSPSVASPGAVAEILLAPPAIAGQHDASVTATSLSLFADCPRRYYLERYLGISGVVREGASTGGRALGVAVHESLAGLRTVRGEAADLADRFRNSELGVRAARAIRVEREFDFLLPLGDVIVNGQIDLWFEEGGELVVVDYKTDADRDAESAYALQLQIYALAIERYAGRLPDRGYLFWLREGDAKEIALSDAAAVTGQIDGFLQAQNTLEFPVRPASRCARCPFYRGACPVELP
ncbi:MAG: 3'-5' exonuclease, partial [Bryobacteraceae bacterium]